MLVLSTSISVLKSLGSGGGGEGEGRAGQGTASIWRAFLCVRQALFSSVLASCSGGRVVVPHVHVVREHRDREGVYAVLAVCT